MKRAWLAIALGFVGCVDTELSVDLRVTGGELVVAADGSLDATVEVDVRVGKHALSGDDLSLSRLGFFVGETSVAELIPMRPEGFDSRIEPGESRHLTIHASATADAYPAAAATLCPGTEATALVTWTAEQQADDPLDPPLMSFGSDDGIVSVVCP